MEKKNQVAAYRDQFCLRQPTDMIIDVAANRDHRCKLFQLVKNSYLPNVAGMQNQVDPRQMFAQFRTEQPVCVAKDGNIFHVRIFKHAVVQITSRRKQHMQESVGMSSRSSVVGLRFLWWGKAAFFGGARLPSDVDLRPEKLVVSCLMMSIGTKTRRAVTKRSITARHVLRDHLRLRLNRKVVREPRPTKGNGAHPPATHYKWASLTPLNTKY
jgi:hypothetical protein